MSYQYENTLNDLIDNSFPFVLIEIVSDNTFFRKSYLITQEGNNVSLNNVLIKKPT